MLLILIVINLAVIGILLVMGLYWVVGSSAALRRTWVRLRREDPELRLLAGRREVVILMAILLLFTASLSVLQVFRHFPDFAGIKRLTRAQRAAGMRDYDLVRLIMDERPWYEESITGKGSILDRHETDSLALARYHFETSDSLFQRYYPLGEAAIHLVGYSTRVRGRAGLESAFNDVLMGQHALSDQLINSLFAVQKVGSDIALTIDYRLQGATYDALKTALMRQRTTRGAACVLDPHTGEVLALVSVPSYTLDQVESGLAWTVLNQEVVKVGTDSVAIVNPARQDTLFYLSLTDNPEGTPVGDAIRYSPDRPIFFRAVRGVYPPGSTFKIVMAAALFENGWDDYRYDSVGKGYVPKGFGKAIRSHGPPINHGIIDIFKAMEISDNEYFASLADSLGGEIVGQFATKMGVMGPMSWNSEDDRMNEHSSLRIPAVEYQARDRFEVAISGIGQGPVVTNPLRMAVTTAIIASGGYRYDPILELGRSPRGQRVLSKEVCDKVRETMLRVVEGEEGTAKSLYMEDLRIAAKTGTAQSPGERRDHSWFVCFAPAEDPKIVVAVIGENAGWGSVVGLNVARKVLLAAREYGYFAEPPGLFSMRTQESSVRTLASGEGG